MRQHPRLIFYIICPLLCILSCAVFTLCGWHLGIDRMHLVSLLLMNILFDAVLIALGVISSKAHIAAARHALQYEYQAYTDAMTQVKNRAAFDLVTEKMSTGAYPRLTLIMADLNNLKQTNDTFGHLAGDRLICSLVECLQESFGSIATIYRYGGDEFILLCEQASLDEVQRARERFDRLILEHSNHGGLEIFVAVGMASRQDALNSGLHVLELLRLADATMYQYKATQKNMPNAYHAYPSDAEQMDAVTGILSFSAFKARVHESLSANRVASPCIVNFDLNFFDGYNGLFGWGAGDEIIQKLTSLALNICGENGFCGHGESDSFWVFTDFPDTDALTRRIAEETRRFQDHLGDFMLFPSFGIYRISDSLAPISDMCSRAISAKRKIKGSLDVLTSIYDTEDHQRQIDSLNLTASLRHALEQGEFVPYFQPKYSGDGKLIVGAEALARRRLEDGSFSTPEEFADLYEKSGLILSLDWHMLTEACIFLRRQLDAGRICVPISVNFSRLHVYEADCAERILHLADEYRLPHELIEIELTETALIQRTESISTLISSIRENGFSVALDNFGAGFSSLELLQHLTVDRIKVGRSLTASSSSKKADSAILSYVVSLCHQLGILAVADGLETAEEYESLRSCGFDRFQGQFFAPVLPEAEFEKLLIHVQPSLARDAYSVPSPAPAKKV